MYLKRLSKWPVDHMTGIFVFLTILIRGMLSLQIRWSKYCHSIDWTITTKRN